MTWEEKVSQTLNSSGAIPRLDIPAFDWWNEGLQGVMRSGYATIFPQTIGMAATWDTPLANQLAIVISKRRAPRTTKHCGTTTTPFITA